LTLALQNQGPEFFYSITPITSKGGHFVTDVIWSAEFVFLTAKVPISKYETIL
jgi:hypothetical protein